MKKLALIALSFVLLACGQSLSGTYVSDFADMTFESGGRLILSTMGVKQEWKYEVNGDNLKIVKPDGDNFILTIQKDGTIQAPWGVMRKKK